MSASAHPPLFALTLGDVAGVGPEVVAKAVADVRSRPPGYPVVIGNVAILERTVRECGLAVRVQPLATLDGKTRAIARGLPADTVLCHDPLASEAAAVEAVPRGANHPVAGRAAYHALACAHAAVADGHLDAIVTAPLSKAALHMAGYRYPGHTEILAELTGVRDFAMMLHLPQGGLVRGPFGISIVHVTLHTSIRSVPELLTTAHIVEKIELLHGFLTRLGCGAPRLGVCALNPHAGEEGLFGDEERRLIAPAVAQCRALGRSASGPWPTDTLVQRAVGGEFDGLVAMYHDQGHIPLKLLGFHRAVNITLGLPIVRTSPSHGTAFDIAGKNIANPEGFIEAWRIAARLL